VFDEADNAKLRGPRRERAGTRGPPARGWAGGSWRGWGVTLGQRLAGSVRRAAPSVKRFRARTADRRLLAQRRAALGDAYDPEAYDAALLAQRAALARVAAPRRARPGRRWSPSHTGAAAVPDATEKRLRLRSPSRVMPPRHSRSWRIPFRRCAPGAATAAFGSRAAFCCIQHHGGRCLRTSLPARQIGGSAGRSWFPSGPHAEPGGAAEAMRASAGERGAPTLVLPWAVAFRASETFRPSVGRRRR
jgi:hypothetical protein